MAKVYPLQIGFQKRGESGIEVSDWWPHVGDCIDDIAVIRSMWTTDNDLPPNSNSTRAGTFLWRLQCSSQDQDRDVTVWMWSGSESTRREVWRGRFQQGVSRVLVIGFTPTDAATPVWAAVEAIGPQGDGMRRLARVPLRNEPLPGIAASAAQLLQDPTTGESILQFTGQPEGGR